ncbi:hypothetical protein IAT40_005682 [Kwoniella sp. CBS 6097]
MKSSLAQTIIPLSLLGGALAGVIQVPRGEPDYDDKKHHDPEPKKHHDKGGHDHGNDVSPEFIGCVSQVFFDLVSHDRNFDGDFTKQANLQECIDHCVDEEFRYTYWDADRKKCYCSPAQRPNADQIRDNDDDTGKCKEEDAIVFLNNAQFRFGGCFETPDEILKPVAQSSATSVRECFTFCDQPCRDQFIEVVAITPRFENALYSFNYLCQCFDLEYYEHYDASPLANRTCAIDSIFGYARAPEDDGHHGKKTVKRAWYDDEESNYKKHDDNEDEDYDYGKDHDDEDDEDDDTRKKHHEEEDDEDEDYDNKKHHDDKEEDEDYDDNKKHHDDSEDEGDSKKHHGDDDDNDEDYDQYKKHHDDDDEDDEDYDKKHHEEDDDDEDYDHHKKHDDDDEEYNYGKKHGDDDDDKDDEYKGYKGNDNEDDDDYHYKGKDHKGYHEDEDNDYDHKGKHEEDPDYDYGKKGDI